MLSSLPLRTVHASQTLLLNEQSRNLEQSGKRVVKFGFGQSPFLPPEPVMQALRDAAHRKEYSPVQGLPELREAIAGFMQASESITFQPEDILIAPGSKILIYCILTAFERADVLIPAPAWVSYAPQAQLAGHRAISLPTSYEQRWRVTPETLRRALRERASAAPAILILNYPGNPDGLTYSPTELAALAAIAREFGVLVISDEIYGLLHHTGQHHSLAHEYPEGTIITTGLSKWCSAGGWRIGVACFPAGLRHTLTATVLGVASETYSCAPTPMQAAACAAYQWTPELQGYLQGQRRILSALGNLAAEGLNAADIRTHAPEGGFYLFPDFSPHAPALAAKGITTSEALCSALLRETGVALLPGSAFGMEPETLAARLAYVTFDGTAALAAATGKTIDETWLTIHTPLAIEGIQALAAWVSD